MTEVTASAAVLCSTGAALPAPVEVTLPLASPTALEPYEGMRATLPQDLAILEFFDFDRFGEIVLGSARQYQPTAVYQPRSRSPRPTPSTGSPLTTAARPRTPTRPGTPTATRSPSTTGSAAATSSPARPG
jgi:hypothetical protein